MFVGKVDLKNQTKKALAHTRHTHTLFLPSIHTVRRPPPAAAAALLAVCACCWCRVGCGAGVAKEVVAAVCDVCWLLVFNVID